MSASVGAVLRVLFGSASGAAYELTGADAGLRAALPLSRRIDVAGVDGGSGTTAVATTLSNVLGRRRSGPVLAVDAAGGHAGLWHRMIDRAPCPADEAETARRSAAGTLSEATTGLPRSATGAYVLDLAGPSRHPASVAEWAEQVLPIARFFDLVITDWGVRPWPADLPAVRQSGHLLVVAGRCDRASATAAATAVTVVGGLDDACSGPMLVLSDVARSADRIAEPLGRALGQRVVVLPWEPAWSLDHRLPTRRFTLKTRRAHIGLAAMIMAEAARGNRPAIDSRRERAGS